MPEVVDSLASLDFARFDEEWFWKDGRSLEARYPGLDLEVYQRIFEGRVAEVADT